MMANILLLKFQFGRQQHSIQVSATSNRAFKIPIPLMALMIDREYKVEYQHKLLSCLKTTNVWHLALEGLLPAQQPTEDWAVAPDQAGKGSDQQPCTGCCMSLNCILTQYPPSPCQMSPWHWLACSNTLALFSHSCQPRKCCDHK